jgi:hypothetical protein
MSLKQRILQAFPAPLHPVLATDDDGSDTEGSDNEGEDSDSDHEGEEEEQEGEEEGSGNVDDTTEEQYDDEELPDVHNQEVAAFMNELLDSKDQNEEHK